MAGVVVSASSMVGGVRSFCNHWTKVGVRILRHAHAAARQMAEHSDENIRAPHVSNWGLTSKGTQLSVTPVRGDDRGRYSSCAPLNVHLWFKNRKCFSCKRRRGDFHGCFAQSKQKSSVIFLYHLATSCAFSVLLEFTYFGNNFKVVCISCVLWTPRILIDLFREISYSRSIVPAVALRTRPASLVLPYDSE